MNFDVRRGHDGEMAGREHYAQAEMWADQAAGYFDSDRGLLMSAEECAARQLADATLAVAHALLSLRDAQR
jgi:hypothetical protein